MWSGSVTFSQPQRGQTTSSFPWFLIFLLGSVVGRTQAGLSPSCSECGYRGGLMFEMSGLSLPPLHILGPPSELDSTQAGWPGREGPGDKVI